jgi:predicted enzyme related to lactoylglutathione lyase
MAIGSLRCHVIDVEDLEVGQRFWSEVTGIPAISSEWPGRYAYLGHEDELTWQHVVILHRVTAAKGVETNRSHVDITVDDLDVAILQIEEIGGRLKRAPSIYPRPGSYPGEPPVIDWAVLQDPFGNEFCLVRELSSDEVDAVERAGTTVSGDDDTWRDVARRARGLPGPTPHYSPELRGDHRARTHP